MYPSIRCSEHDGTVVRRVAGENFSHYATLTSLAADVMSAREAVLGLRPLRKYVVGNQVSCTWTGGERVTFYDILFDQTCQRCRVA